MATLLLSNSTSPGRPYLAHARDWIADALAGAERVAFVPYAAVTFSDDAYLDRVREALDGLGLEVVGVHASADPAGVVGAADAVMVGGGNTFHLLRAMYRHGLVERDKLAGWPLWVQGPERPRCPQCRSTMRVVFQIVSEDTLPIVFGDMGTGHLSVCPKHPDVLAFGWACT